MKYLLLLLFIPTLLSASVILKNIIISPNLFTKEQTIHDIIAVTSGDTITEESLAAIKTRLFRVDLFKKIEVTTDSTGTLFLDLSEKDKYDLSDLGGAIYQDMYGESTTIPWLKVNFAVRNRNFQGQGQDLLIKVRTWNIRTVGAEWVVPFYKQNLYTRTGLEFGTYPSIEDRWHADRMANGYVALGRYITLHSRLEAEIREQYRLYDLIDEDRRETVIEPKTSINWIYDERDNWYATNRGLYLANSFSSNILYPYKSKSYLSYHLDSRYFLSTTDNRHTLATRFWADALFWGDYNRFEKLYIGGRESVRGFSSGTFGKEDTYNNSFTTSTEYRFHLFHIPSLQMNWLSWYHSSLVNFPVLIKGAVFVDGGYIWKELIKSVDEGKSALGTGTGLRIIFPEMEMAGSIDFGWTLYPEVKNIIPKFYVYVDLPF